MKKLSILAATALLSLGAVYSAEKKSLNVVDYFLLLPRDYFEGTPATWLGFLKQPKCGVIDLANGYMSCTGDGAQPEFEVALFRYRDPARGGLLAVCSGELEGPDSVYLEFLELGADGKMHRARRSIIPVGDAGNDRGNWRFQLPRAGKTVLVRHQASGKILRKFTWNGANFQEEK
jgi:hypothetical protein